jgi:pimeloyl-ACP methyl ester carboxylesterase
MLGAFFMENSVVTRSFPPRIFYRWANVDGLNIFYREAGEPGRPTIVLLHGFPSSSYMFRELIPKLSTDYHVIAADMPGFGYTDQPLPADFEYTFANLAKVMSRFLTRIGLDRFSIFVQDYGSPIGFRIFDAEPERIQAIITQNGNAYEEGLSSFWNELIQPYWRARSAETEQKIRDLLTFASTRFQYEKGTRKQEHISPDPFHFDQMILDREGNKQIQMDLLYDYHTNPVLYPKWHETLRRIQPPLLAVWGKNDPIFLPAGAEAFKRDVPKAEIRLLDTGHFALEEESSSIANYILDFLARNIHHNSLMAAPGSDVGEAISQK